MSTLRNEAFDIRAALAQDRMARRVGEAETRRLLGRDDEEPTMTRWPATPAIRRDVVTLVRGLRTVLESGT